MNGGLFVQSCVSQYGLAHTIGEYAAATHASAGGSTLYQVSPVVSFICHPAVRPSILAKRNGAVYDFLLDSRKTSCETCIILDLPGKSKKEIAEYFCYRISNEDYCNVYFSFDGVASVPRVVLKDDATEVLKLVNGYAKERSLSQPDG